MAARLNQTMKWLRLLLWILPLTAQSSPANGDDPKPNVVLILADDLGYGDVRCLNQNGKISTPNLDRLAAEGMVFTDAHSSSAVCTPSRYSILTGRYNWRSRLKRGVLNGYSPPLIEPGRLTLPAMLQQKGYHTACIGKWHLGMHWSLTNGGFAKGDASGWMVDHAQPVRDGPLEHGFDHFYGISASLDMPPYLFIENQRAAGLPSVEKTWIRKGPAVADFEAIEVLPELAKRGTTYIEQRAEAARKGHPFFLYLSLTSPHTPILPSPQWQGKSITSYADFVMQTDHVVGEIMSALTSHGLQTNTLLIFSSDNGCSPQANYPELEAKGHHPSAHFRGAKADLFEGGHRVPFIARWPGKVKAGSVSADLIGQVDLMATCAALVGFSLPTIAAEDSISFAPILLHRPSGTSREAIVHHSINGSFAIRQGHWKLLLCPDSGGWSYPRPGSKEARTLPPVQLYNLSTDIGETRNLQDMHPEKVHQLKTLLELYTMNGGCTDRQATPAP